MEEKSGARPGCIFAILLLLFITGVFVRLIADSARESRLQREELDAKILKWQREEAARATPAVTAAPALDPASLEIPVVGMKEADINKTKHPYPLAETVTSVVRGDRITYYSDARPAWNRPVRITVKCVNGVVTEVRDYRADPLSVPRSSGKKAASTKKPGGGYADPEEYYYEHEEEFDDMDDAEEAFEDLYG